MTLNILTISTYALFLLASSGVLSLSTYYLYIFYKKYIEIYLKPHKILTTPPNNLAPGAMYYFVKRRYNSQTMALDLLDMELNGWLTITRETSDIYVLNKGIKQDNHVLYSHIYDVLFTDDGNDSLAIQSYKKNNIIKKVWIMSENWYENTNKHYIVERLETYLFYISMTILITCSIITYFVPHLESGLPLLCIVLSIALLSTAKNYTREGWNLYRDIVRFQRHNTSKNQYPTVYTSSQTFSWLQLMLSYSKPDEPAYGE